jgi:predicted MFS family arabinose efflux permease
MKALERFSPLRLAGGAVVLAVLPFWILVLTLPWEAVGVVLLASGVFVPLVNAPAMGLLTTRPPEALRAKVMTAVMTATALGGPAGRLVVGPMFLHWGIPATYAAIAAVITLAAVLFLAVAMRGETEPASAPAHDFAV